MSYSFRAVRAAILDAAPAPGSLPYGEPLTSARLAALRAAPWAQNLLGEMRDEAARAMATPPPLLPFARFREFEDDGSRKGYERPYFARRGRLLALALHALIDETNAPLSALEDLIWTICDEYSWAPPACLPVGVMAAHEHFVPPDQVVDLFAAETAHALAETIYLLGDRLHPWVVHRARAEIERRVFAPLWHSPARFGWESVTNNWAAVCGGAVGMAALLLEAAPVGSVAKGSGDSAAGDRERLAGLLDRLLRALDSFLDGFGADGGCAEGIGYWVYGFGYFTYFAEMLRTYTGDRLDLLGGERMAQIVGFPATIALAAGRYVPFSDSFGGVAPTRLPTGLLSRLGARTGRALPSLDGPPTFHSDHCYRFAHLTRTLFWTDPADLGRPTTAGTAYLPDLAWLIDRRQVDGVPVAFAAKGGHNAEPHNHNDLGHFVLHLGGEDLLADLGAGLYTRQYFREERYTYLHPSSEGHSVPVIDGRGQMAGRQHEAEVLRQVARDDGVEFALDLTRAYNAPGLLSFRRAFSWAVGEHGSARLELTDAFRFATPPQVLDESFISRRRPQLDEGTATWVGERGAITLHFDADRLRPTVEELRDRDHADQPLVVHRLRLARIEPHAEETCRLVFTCQVANGSDRAVAGASSA